MRCIQTQATNQMSTKCRKGKACSGHVSTYGNVNQVDAEAAGLEKQRYKKVLKLVPIFFKTF